MTVLDCSCAIFRKCFESVQSCPSISLQSVAYNSRPDLRSCHHLAALVANAALSSEVSRELDDHQCVILFCSSDSSHLFGPIWLYAFQLQLLQPEVYSVFSASLLGRFDVRLHIWVFSSFSFKQKVIFCNIEGIHLKCNSIRFISALGIVCIVLYSTALVQ